MWDWTNHDAEREVMVWESNGYWSRGLRRHFGTDISVVRFPEFPAREATDIAHELSRPPAAMVIVVRPSWDVSIWQSLAELQRRAPQSLLLTIVRRDDALGFVWSMILGAKAVFHDLGQLDDAANLIRRFWISLPQPQLSLDEAI